MQLRPPTDTEAIIANARSIGPAIEDEADEFAKERRLTDDAVALMRRAGLFRIAFPKAWGGPEMDVLSQCEVNSVRCPSRSWRPRQRMRRDNQAFP
jgi:alkylation response protein AidB-like acyl-CoA dehydrogenase